jgi:type I restriction enzyme R subunit
MPPTDTSEKGLETLIFQAMTGRTGLETAPELFYEVSPTAAGGTGWLAGWPRNYDRTHSLDTPQLFAFLHATQPDELKKLGIATYTNKSDIALLKFLARIDSELGSRGVVDVLRSGIKHGPLSFELFYATPSPGNPKAAQLHAQNRFSITRQVRYSTDETRRALDLVIFINGLPIATFELKNSLTKQTVEDAVEQYRRDRDPREKLFQLGRCVAHYAVDENEVQFCTELKGKGSWFLPFNQGWNDGAGNPPNPNGLKTDYLWQRILPPRGLTNILENYAQLVETKNEKTGRKKYLQIFPRYHQLEVVRELLADVSQHGAGKRYLIQHSAGSGKSNSIAWLAHQLISLRNGDREIFDSVIVITDRRLLDEQIQATIKRFVQVGETVGHAEHSGDLRKFIEGGKKIIISTVQKFPFILDEIGDEHRNRRFAIIIDEAHSSQGGKTSAALNEALSDPEDTINDALQKRMDARKVLSNASYFAFTATPKNKTLEMFGCPLPPDAEGKVKHEPFHCYTMKQAIQEGFILDVLKSYTPVDSYYKLVKKVESDPEFDTKKARKKLRKYVESHDHAIRLKAEIMVDHFHEQVLALNKIGGKARAIVVCSGIERAIQYYHAIREYLVERKSPYLAVVAFSGEPEYGGVKVTESSLNGFPSNEIAAKFREEPFRFLVCADKFQTGYDEPLLHTMYVDKPLSGIKAVQTLSRLNRAHPQKHDVFVLDFLNNTETITEAFADYYRTTVLSEETDPNKLHDFRAALDNCQVYTPVQIDSLVTLYLSGAERDKLDPILDACVARYIQSLNEDAQVDFKGKAKAFTRTYDFLASILPYTNREWEKLSIFLTFLIPKLPAPIEEDLAKGILEAIDMDSYRAEKKAALKILLPDADAEIDPVPASGGGRKLEPELDRLSNILKSFNDHFGTFFTDADRVAKRIRDDIAPKVAADRDYQNARENTPNTARIEHDKALARVMLSLLKDDTEIYKQFVQNESFKRFVTDMVFEMTNG